MAKELKCEFQKEIDNEKVCKAFEVNRYGDIICQEEDCQLCKFKTENELIKAQYNCYTCGNCKGKEDYINLEKHHKGLRKQFDKKVRALQEIKAVAEAIEKELEPQSVEHQLRLRGKRELASIILDLITKAEKE